MERRQNLELALLELRNTIHEMGLRVNQAIRESIETLKTQDREKARHIIEQDQAINALEEKVMEIGAITIATQQPVAKDMRKVLIAFRIASDLERMGDLATDIAKVTLRIGDQELIKPLIDLPRMAELTSEMLSESMEAYAKESMDMAFKTAKIDDEVDHLYSQIFRELLTMMLENPKIISQSMLLIMVARYLERIADHATNIGESVVYMVSGKRPDLNK